MTDSVCVLNMCLCVRDVRQLPADKASLARENARLAIATLRDNSSDDESHDLLRAEALLASSKSRSNLVVRNVYVT